jgi:hypothetical protein
MIRTGADLRETLGQLGKLVRVGARVAHRLHEPIALV